MYIIDISLPVISVLNSTNCLGLRKVVHITSVFRRIITETITWLFYIGFTCLGIEQYTPGSNR